MNKSKKTLSKEHYQKVKEGKEKKQKEEELKYGHKTCSEGFGNHPLIDY